MREGAHCAHDPAMLRLFLASASGGGLVDHRAAGRGGAPVANCCKPMSVNATRDGITPVESAWPRWAAVSLLGEPAPLPFRGCREVQGGSASGNPAGLPEQGPLGPQGEETWGLTIDKSGVLGIRACPERLSVRKGACISGADTNPGTVVGNLACTLGGVRQKAAGTCSRALVLLCLRPSPVQIVHARLQGPKATPMEATCEADGALASVPHRQPIRL